MKQEITVGLIAGELRQRAEQSLRHILAQTALDRMDIVVVDVNPESGVFEGADHPRVRYLHRPNFQYYCDAQSEIAQQSKTPLIAFLEDHCYAVPGWVEAILKAFENPRVAAVNYTFTNAGHSSYRSRSILLSEYGHWMVPHPGGRIAISASTNVAYRRELLLPVIGGEGTPFEAEFMIHRAIQQSGGEIHVAPLATVAHESWQTVWEACLANGANKRVLGSRRAERGQWGAGRRLFWALGMTLAPGLFIARLMGALRKRPSLWVPFITSLPVLAMIYSYCAWSEALGYLFGAGESREEFRARELAVQRDD